jgi:hypothetical protein
MQSFKKCGVLVVVVVALSALGAGNASAAEFTASATGSLTGENLEPRVFTVNGGTISCSKALLTGEIKLTSATEQYVTLHYSECKAFGLVGVHVSTAEFLATADGTLHMLDPFVVTVTKTLFTAECTITFPEQTLETFDFVSTYTHTEKTETKPTTTLNHGIKSTPTVTGMEYTSSGGVCGSSGTNGTLAGAMEILRVGGGWLAFDA